MRRSKGHQLLVYILLFAGAAVFAFPFVWMVSGSVKVDREQFAPDFHVLPQTPLPALRSPYVDREPVAVPDASADRVAALLPGIEGLVRVHADALPDDVDRDALVAQAARGVLARLAQRLPAETWHGPIETLVERARPLVDAVVVGETADAVYRYLGIGPLRVRGSDAGVVALDAGAAPSSAWTIGGDAAAHASDATDGGRRVMKLAYNLTTGNTIVLRRTLALPFAARDLQRVQIDLRPDDSWHDYAFTLEHDGRRYVGHRSGALSDAEWLTATWQHAGPDDASTKLRTWVTLDDAGPSDVTDAHAARVTLTITRASQATAWANKLRANYVRAEDQMPLGRYLRVSLFLVLAKIALTIFGSSLAAYAFARIVWPGRDLCFLLMLATMMIPAQVTMIPHFLIWTSVGGYDTLGPLWIGAAFGNAFFIFMLRQFMRGIPRDLEDAARIDGCGFLRIYWHVILPLIVPSLAAIAVMTFIGTWNDFLGPLLYIADQRLYPLAFGIYAFSVQVNNNPALTMAASVLMTVPIIAIFFAAQRYFIQGITLTGMKG